MCSTVAMQSDEVYRLAQSRLVELEAKERELWYKEFDSYYQNRQRLTWFGKLLCSLWTGVGSGHDNMASYREAVRNATLLGGAEIDWRFVGGRAICRRLISATVDSPGKQVFLSVEDYSAIK